MGRTEYLKRFILWLPITVFRFLRRILFQFTSDSKYLASLKNTHCGERCFIIGNGPSLATDDLDKLKNEFTFASNRIYNLFSKTDWRPSIYMSVDNDVIRHEHEKMEQLTLPVQLINITSKAYSNFDPRKVHFFTMYGPYIIRQYKYRKRDISKNPAKYFSMSYSVTCLEIELAIYMGFKEIYLLGCDHNYSHYINAQGKYVIDNKVQDYCAGIERKTFTMQFKDATTSCYQAYQEYAQTHDVKIYNATRGGQLEVYPRVRLEEVLGFRKEEKV